VLVLSLFAAYLEIKSLGKICKQARAGSVMIVCTQEPLKLASPVNTSECYL